MPLPRWIRSTTVHIEGGGVEPLRRHTPGVPSRHEQLLRDQDATGGETWAAQALRQVLRQVADGHVIEPIAVVDAWTENADTFCVVYTPPWGPDPLVGVRRVRGDLDPVVQIGSAVGADDLSSFEMPDDPVEYAADVVDDISEPLGNTRLHRAANSFAWWGTVDGWHLRAWAER